MDFERRERRRLHDRLLEGGGIDGPIRAQQDDDARDEQLQRSNLRVVGAGPKVGVAAEQVVQVVDARLDVTLPIVDAPRRQSRKKREHAGRLGRNRTPIQIEPEQHG